jgi:2-hydroxychromene-2-carboxylate isomerase
LLVTPIEFSFDFASPYGFLAAMQIDGIVRPVVWRPFLLGAVYKQVGQSPLDHPAKRDYIIKVDAPRMARRIGLALEVPQGFPEHSLPPARAFYWIDRQDLAAAVAYAKAAYRLYWLEGRSTADPDAAAEAGQIVGLARDALLAGIQESNVKERLARENVDAIAKGVFGSPFFIADGEPFWGGDRIELLCAAQPNSIA